MKFKESVCDHPNTTNKQTNKQTNSNYNLRSKFIKSHLVSNCARVPALKCPRKIFPSSVSIRGVLSREEHEVLMRLYCFLRLRNEQFMVVVKESAFGDDESTLSSLYPAQENDLRKSKSVPVQGLQYIRRSEIELVQYNPVAMSYCLYQCTLLRNVPDKLNTSIDPLAFVRQRYK